MTCNCYSDVTERLTTHYRETLPDGSLYVAVDLGGYVFGITTDGGVTHRAACAATVTYEAPKKAGGLKRVKKTVQMRATFCPFCGVAYEPPKVEASGGDL